MPTDSHAPGARQAPQIDTSDRYDLAALDRALAGTAFAGQIHHFAEISSTNTHAMQQGTLGAPHGSVYLADAQSAGRGRGAHAWSSPPETGLYVSVLLRPALTPGDALWVSLGAGLAALAAIRRATGAAADLRWPNDLLFGRRKVAGILTEMHAEATRVRYLVVGVGINVHQASFPAELAGAATSLAMEGHGTMRSSLLVALLGELAEETAALARNPAAAQTSLRERLEAASSWMHGKHVIVDEGQADADASFTGTTAGLDERGFLQVRVDGAAKGHALRTVLSGSIREQERVYDGGQIRGRNDVGRQRNARDEEG